MSDPAKVALDWLEEAEREVSHDEPHNVRAVRAELDRLRSDKKARALRQARLLLIVHNAILGKQDQIAKQFGGNAPEDIQILLDDAHVLHATLDELRAENTELRERVAELEDLLRYIRAQGSPIYPKHLVRRMDDALESTP